MALAVQLFGLLRSGRQYQLLPELPRLPDSTGSDLDAPLVSIVVPARNEERNLPKLLASLRRLDYPSLEVIVVNDGSTDETRAHALAAGARVIDAPPPPWHWKGKCWACWCGVRESRGRWVLFTDADTEHRPDSLRSAVEFARAGGWHLVSLLLQQRCDSFWERVCLPYAYALYFAGVEAESINSPSGAAVSNGQYLLVDREAYFRSGGHEAVASSVVEDVRLADRFMKTGQRVLLLRGEWAASVRMYGNLREIRAGLSKNSTEFAVRTGRGAVGIIGTSVAGIGVVEALLANIRRPLGWLYILATALVLLRWYRRFGVSVWYSLLSPAGVVAVQAIVFEGLVRRLTHTAVWKGRSLT